MLNFETLPLDAEFIDDLLPAEIQPTAVLMNPPFSSTRRESREALTQFTERDTSRAHLRRLQEGGRLVAIVSEGDELSPVRALANGGNGSLVSTTSAQTFT